MELFQETIATITLVFTVLALLTAMASLFVKVPYVPTKKQVALKMIKVAHLKKNDIVYDLGCGDGRLLFEAEKNADINAKGYELAPIPYFFAKIQQFFLKSKTSIQMANFFSANLKDANIIFCYLSPDIMVKLYKKIKKECKKGTKIVSNTFSVRGVEPSRVWIKNQKQKLPNIYLYEI